MDNTEQFSSDESRWNAVVNRERVARGLFYYAVKTTGIFCRPGCSSRLPNRKNVEFFDTCEEAEQNGYRPCKRCAPKAASQDADIEKLIIQACRDIEQTETVLTLDDLAETAGLSPSHFHRLFKKTLGVTPKQYSAGNRYQRFCNALKTSPSVTEAIYNAGYGSSSRAYEKVQQHLAMRPKTFQKGAAGIPIRYGISQCFLGWIIVAATDRGICAIELGDDPNSLPDQIQKNFPNALVTKASSGFASMIEEVVSFIEAPEKGLNIPLDIQGTAFQQRVWSSLRQIPPGSTLSYAEIAVQIGSPQAARAVGQACAANKLAGVIPCHRALSKDGKTTGFRWGVERKALLLNKEKKSS